MAYYYLTGIPVNILLDEERTLCLPIDCLPCNIEEVLATRKENSYSLWYDGDDERYALQNSHALVLLYNSEEDFENGTFYGWLDCWSWNCVMNFAYREGFNYSQLFPLLNHSLEDLIQYYNIMCKKCFYMIGGFDLELSHNIITRPTPEQISARLKGYTLQLWSSTQEDIGSQLGALTQSLIKGELHVFVRQEYTRWKSRTSDFIKEFKDEKALQFFVCGLISMNKQLWKKITLSAIREDCVAEVVSPLYALTGEVTLAKWEDVLNWMWWTFLDYWKNVVAWKVQQTPTPKTPKSAHWKLVKDETTTQRKQEMQNTEYCIKKGLDFNNNRTKRSNSFGSTGSGILGVSSVVDIEDVHLYSPPCMAKAINPRAVMPKHQVRYAVANTLHNLDYSLQQGREFFTAQYKALEKSGRRPNAVPYNCDNVWSQQHSAITCRHLQQTLEVCPYRGSSEQRAVLCVSHLGSRCGKKQVRVIVKRPVDFFRFLVKHKAHANNSNKKIRKK